MTLISFVRLDISYCDVSLDILHLLFTTGFFIFLVCPSGLFSLSCARSRHSVRCHWVSLCFKTHNPVRSWHGNVHLMPVKILQSVRRYMSNGHNAAHNEACLYVYVV